MRCNGRVASLQLVGDPCPATMAVADRVSCISPFKGLHVSLVDGWRLVAMLVVSLVGGRRLPLSVSLPSKCIAAGVSLLFIWLETRVLLPWLWPTAYRAFERTCRWLLAGHWLLAGCLLGRLSSWPTAYRAFHGLAICTSRWLLASHSSRRSSLFFHFFAVSRLFFLAYGLFFLMLLKVDHPISTHSPGSLRCLLRLARHALPSLRAFHVPGREASFALPD